MFKMDVCFKEDLFLVYLLGVVEFCWAIVVDFEKVYDYIIKSNIVVIVFDGLVVLGLGNIGLYVAILVMEGKVMFFKCFVNIDVFLVCLDMQDIEKIIEIVKLIVLVFGGINLEDILVFCSFEIE